MLPFKTLELKVLSSWAVGRSALAFKKALALSLGAFGQNACLFVLAFKPLKKTGNCENYENSKKENGRTEGRIHFWWRFALNI